MISIEVKRDEFSKICCIGKVSEIYNDVANVLKCAYSALETTLSKAEYSEQEVLEEFKEISDIVTTSIFIEIANKKEQKNDN